MEGLAKYLVKKGKIKAEIEGIGFRDFEVERAFTLEPWESLAYRTRKGGKVLSEKARLVVVYREKE